MTLRAVVCVILLGVALIPSGGASAERIASDTTWEGTVTVDGQVVVEAGATLTIRPGTEVRFKKTGTGEALQGAMAEGSGLLVRGTLMAVGEPDKRILFTSSEQEKEVGDWGEIMIESGAPSVIANADFEYATWGLHLHFTNVEVRDSTFRKNNGGIRFRSGPVEIHDNLFRGNYIGIRSYLGGGRIYHNICTGNEMGIFISRATEAITIKENNIYGNHRYNLRIGDFEQNPIDVSNNWWGSAKEEDIEAGIYDGKRDEQVGKALYNPFLGSPADITGSAAIMAGQSGTDDTIKGHGGINDD